MAKQDDGLSDLSNVLDELKYMAVDMGSEIDRSVCFDLSHYFRILLLLSLSLSSTELVVLCSFFFPKFNRRCFDCCRQNKALDPFMNDVDELNSRVKGANQRGRRLLGK